MKTVTKVLVMAAMSMLWTGRAGAHCEVPCGIYGDETRITQLEEHAATMAKAAAQITALAKEGEKNYNQIVRWVSTKEEHAEAFQHIVWQYFLTQRIKPVDAKDARAHDVYLKKLEVLHLMSVSAMKAKQSTDPEPAEKLKTLVAEFRALYTGK